MRIQTAMKKMSFHILWSRLCKKIKHKHALVSTATVLWNHFQLFLHIFWFPPEKRQIYQARCSETAKCARVQVLTITCSILNRLKKCIRWKLQVENELFQNRCHEDKNRRLRKRWQGCLHLLIENSASSCIQLTLMDAWSYLRGFLMHKVVAITLLRLLVL